MARAPGVYIRASPSKWTLCGRKKEFVVVVPPPLFQKKKKKKSPLCDASPQHCGEGQARERKVTFGKRRNNGAVVL